MSRIRLVRATTLVGSAVLLVLLQSGCGISTPNAGLARNVAASLRDADSIRVAERFGYVLRARRT
jgi:hypothetical protein